MPKTSDKTRLYFFVMLKSQLIGQIYLKHINKTQKSAEFGIALINDSVKGRGYGTAAIKLLIDHASTTLGLEKICADTLCKNILSQHILTKLGFEFTHEQSGFKYYELKISV